MSWELSEWVDQHSSSAGEAALSSASEGCDKFSSLEVGVTSDIGIDVVAPVEFNFDEYFLTAIFRFVACSSFSAIALFTPPILHLRPFSC